MSIFSFNENNLSASDQRLFFDKYPWMVNVTNDMKDMVGVDGSIFIDISDFDLLPYNDYIRQLKIIVNEAKETIGKDVVIVIPVYKYSSGSGRPLYDPRESNHIAHLYRNMKDRSFKSDFKDCTFVFENGDDGYFKLTVNNYNQGTYLPKFARLIDTMSKSGMRISKNLIGNTEELTAKQVEAKRSNAAISSGVVKSSNPAKPVKNKNEEREATIGKKEELKTLITDAVEDADGDEMAAMDALDNDEYAKALIKELSENENNKMKISAARNARIIKVNEEFMKKRYGDKTFKQIIEEPTPKELPTAKIKVDSINDEWNDLKFINFEKTYNLNDDIVRILSSFSDKEEYPVAIRNIAIEDTSTSQDYIDTYVVECEDKQGKRFTLTFDVPQFIENRFMYLRGNKKINAGQLLLIPCSKTDNDTVQLVSNYNKIFIRRYGFSGKSFGITDRFLKAINKVKSVPGFEVSVGDNSKICTMYELPVDYIDLAGELTAINTPKYTIIFDQNMIRKNVSGINLNKGLPFAVDKETGSIVYYNGDEATFGLALMQLMKSDPASENNDSPLAKFMTVFDATKPANRLMYSKASIMSNEIPVVVLLGYQLGFTKLIKDAAIDGKLYHSLQKYDKDTHDIIKFADGGCFIYKIDYESSMLLGGLKDCDTRSISIYELDKRSTWVGFLENFGGRILADGLDNFNDLFMDPITVETCKDYGLPTDYTGIIIYANNLLADNKYIKHTNITGNRYRTNEVVAGYVYKALSKSYAEYKLLNKKGRKVGMTMKRTAVIDAILTDSMTSDLSILNSLFEVEAANTVSFKGLSGMNTDRAYSLDKRTYDESMINKLALSTGFAANVGISRQTTIDMDVQGTRGYIKDTQDTDDMSITKTFSMAEALTPFGTTRDDPFRSAMTFIQTSKHSMRTDKSMPLLITNGADEALPYMTSDTFAYKAKDAGSVIEINNEYMLIEYNSGEREYIDLTSNVEKNSDGGFFVPLKLDTDLKVGSKFKTQDIIAYDKKSFSKIGGSTDNLAYNLGLLCKVALTSTDEGFEDSTIISDWMSEALASDVIVPVEITLSKNTNIYNIVKKGQAVQEGDPLLIFQNAFNEDDANALLKAITIDEDIVSDLGRIKKKSKVTGIVEDVKFYRTAKLEECSDSIQKIFKEYEKRVKTKKAIYKKNNIKGANRLDADYELPQTGKLKNVQDGIRIEFYLRYHDKFKIGDKNVAQSAAKGVAKDIFPKGKEPWSEYRPEETIHGLYSVASFNARMITSVLVSGAINKAMIELDRQVKDIMNIPIKYLEEIE